MKGYDKQLYVSFFGKESSQQEMRMNTQYLSVKYAGMPNELLSSEAYENEFTLANKFAQMCEEHELDFHADNVNAVARDDYKTLGFYIAVHGAISDAAVNINSVGKALALLCKYAKYRPRKICVDSCHSAEGVKNPLIPEDANVPENAVAIKLGKAVHAEMLALGVENDLVGCVMAGYRDVVVKHLGGSKELNSLGMYFPKESEGVHTYYKDGGPKGRINYSQLRPAPIVRDNAFVDTHKPQFSKRTLLHNKSKQYLETKENTNPQLKLYIASLERYLQKKKAWKFAESKTWVAIRLDEYSTGDIFKFLKIDENNTVIGILNPNYVAQI